MAMGLLVCNSSSTSGTPTKALAKLSNQRSLLTGLDCGFLPHIGLFGFLILPSIRQGVDLIEYRGEFATLFGEFIGYFGGYGGLLMSMNNFGSLQRP